MSDAPTEPGYPVSIRNRGPARGVGYAGEVLELVCDLAHPPGRPLELTLQLPDGMLTLSGKIINDEPFTPTDADNDGDLDGPFATGTGRYGIRTNGAFNGNILITEPRAGRAFEITRDGRMVWWYVNRFDAERVAKVSQATRYPSEYAAFISTGCPAAVAGGVAAPAAIMR